MFRTVSCLCLLQYVWLAGQLQTGNCILNLDKGILIGRACQCKNKTKKEKNKQIISHEHEIGDSGL